MAKAPGLVFKNLRRARHAPAELVTRKVDDFKPIAGLKRSDPFAPPISGASFLRLTGEDERFAASSSAYCCFARTATSFFISALTRCLAR